MVTLDALGNPSAYFVFQVGGALSFAASSHVALTGGAQASHVFWQVDGAAAVGATATFAGTMIAHDAGAVGAGTIVNGRIFALGGALTLDDNDVYAGPPAITIAGGPSAYTRSTAPTISGTTDQAAPTVVTVTVDGQTLTTTPSGGSWSVASPMVVNGTYTITASATDGAGNTTTATQQLTVDTLPPIVTLGAGRSLTTNNPTPTIAGTSDAAPGTLVRVSVDATQLTALVQLDGTWNIQSAALAEGPHTVTATSSPRRERGHLDGDAHDRRRATDPDGVGWRERAHERPDTDDHGTAAVAPGTVVTVTSPIRR